MKKIVAAFALLMFAVTMGFAQDKGIVVDIWPDGLPNTNGVDLTKPFDDATGNYKPQITVYLPEKSKATGQAVLCIPGGGYGIWLDTPMIELLHGEGTIEKRIPAMLRMYLKYDIDMRKQPILIYPTLHYQKQRHQYLLALLGP